MTIEITPDLITRYIPNILVEVEGEHPLVDKLAPFLRSSARFLTSIVGDIDDFSEAHKEIIVQACVKHAFASAIPSLDIVLTPTGFGVVSTDTIAPASKERIERLVASLMRDASELLIQFVNICLTYPKWRESAAARPFCATFIQSLADIRLFQKPEQSPLDPAGLMTLHAKVTAIASRLENALEEQYLGEPLMTQLRKGLASGEYHSAHRVVGMIRQADFRYVTIHLNDTQFSCPEEHELWHSARPIVASLERYPDLYALWEENKGDYFKITPFKNTRHGAYFF